MPPDRGPAMRGLVTAKFGTDGSSTRGSCPLPTAIAGSLRRQQEPAVRKVRVTHLPTGGIERTHEARLDP